MVGGSGLGLGAAVSTQVYMVATLLRKAIELKELPETTDAIWCALMLSPYDYSKEAIHNQRTR